MFDSSVPVTRTLPLGMPLYKLYGVKRVDRRIPSPVSGAGPGIQRGTRHPAHVLLFVRGNSHTRGNIWKLSVQGLQSLCLCQVLAQEYSGASADMWSFGVIVFMLITGGHSFYQHCSGIFKLDL